jgi:hypothetical protein
MTLQQFITSKPSCLRLGQHFVNQYWKTSDSMSQYLYQLDGKAAENYIRTLLDVWQWNELPELKEY